MFTQGTIAGGSWLAPTPMGIIAGGSRLLREGTVKEQLYDLVRSYIDKCNRCGDCRAVCPVFAEDPVETSVARGKLLLAGRYLSGELPASETLRDRLDRCLLCERCTFRCGFHLRVDRVMVATRAVLNEELGLAGAKKLVFGLLADHTSALDLLCAAGTATAPIWGSSVPRDSGLRLRFPVVPGLGADKVIPRPVARPFRSRVPVFSPAPEGNMKVAFFTGCYINHVAPGVGKDTMSLLKRAGVSVFVPKSQGCCGTPMVASGDVDTALRLMRQNLDALLAEEVDAVVVSCATCGTALRDAYPNLLARLDPSLAEKADRLASRTYDISEFLAEFAPLPAAPALKKEVTVTYHDSCHLVRGLKVQEQPRKLLQSIGNVRFVEMEDADYCCGGAGAFSFTQQQLSRRITGRKAERIAATGADFVASGCHGCNLQIVEGLARVHAPVRTLHTVQLLEMAYRGEK